MIGRKTDTLIRRISHPPPVINPAKKQITSVLGSGTPIVDAEIVAVLALLGSSTSPPAVMKLGPGPNVATLMLVMPGDWPVKMKVPSSRGVDRSEKPRSDVSPRSTKALEPLVDIKRKELSQAELGVTSAAETTVAEPPVGKVSSTPAVNNSLPTPTCGPLESCDTRTSTAVVLPTPGIV